MPRDDDFYHGLERTRPAGGRIVVAVVLLFVICGLTAGAWIFIHWEEQAGQRGPGRGPDVPGASDRRHADTPRQ